MDLHHTLEKVAHHAGCDLVIGPVAYEFVRDGAVLESVRYADRPSPTKLLAKLRSHATRDEKLAKRRARQALRQAREAEKQREKARAQLGKAGGDVLLVSRHAWLEKCIVSIRGDRYLLQYQPQLDLFTVMRCHAPGRHKKVLPTRSRLRARVIRIWRLATIAGII